MNAYHSVSDAELLALLACAVRSERAASADVIAHLAEVDRRQLYLDEACSSLFAYCIERLGYSEDGATKRVRVARLAQRFPRLLDELASGALHLTGLFLLSRHLTDDNAEALLSQARGKPRRELEQLLARWFPRPDVPERIEPAPATPLFAEPATSLFAAPASITWPGPGNSAPTPSRARIEPLSPTSYRVELTVSAELYEKLQQARNLLSHALPSGDLAALFERAIDQLLEVERRRRTGANQPRQRRAQKPGSRHVPVDVKRRSWIETRTRARGRVLPPPCARGFAGGAPPPPRRAAPPAVECHRTTVHRRAGRRCREALSSARARPPPLRRAAPRRPSSLRLLCSAHNAHAAQQVFGEEHIERKARRSQESPQARARSGRRLGAGLQGEARPLTRVAPQTDEPAIEPLRSAQLLTPTGPPPRGKRWPRDSSCSRLARDRPRLRELTPQRPRTPSTPRANLG
ncbi:MAG: hypothetical protein IPI67_13745 [Myxococcales bacterium]|nr:hypothetical protein [Myxococcales bacterium]